MSPWRDWLNAEIYDGFVRTNRIYDWLNERLVQIAEVGSARRILDLACGTGATAIACLRVMPAESELVGVDASEAMVSVARAQVQDPRCRFEVAPASDLSPVEGEFDCAVCNAAIWQFPAIRPALEQVRERLSPSARFTFNIPAERVEGESGSIHPFQVALASAIQDATGQTFSRAPSSTDPAALERMLKETGFSLRGTERWVYQGRQGEMMELMEIPAMITPLTPNLSPEQREAVIERARGSVDPAERVEVPWIYFNCQAVARS